VDGRRIAESFKPEYKDEEAGRVRMQPGGDPNGKIKTGLSLQHFRLPGRGEGR